MVTAHNYWAFLFIARQWPRLLVEAWFLTTAFGVLFIAGRRLMGGLTTSLDFLPAICVSVGIVTYFYRLRLLARHHSNFGDSQACDRTVTILGALLLCSLSIPEMSSLTKIIMWLPWLATEAHWWFARLETPIIRTESAAVASAVATLPSVALEVRSYKHNEQILQEYSRTQTGEQEIISGVITFRFAAYQQIAVEHIPFVPALPTIPSIETEPIEADAITIRATDIQTYGVRLEAKRTGALPAARIAIAFEIVADFAAE
jgi:hypothetical protein